MTVALSGDGGDRRSAAIPATSSSRPCTGQPAVWRRPLRRLVADTTNGLIAGITAVHCRDPRRLTGPACWDNKAGSRSAVPRAIAVDISEYYAQLYSAVAELAAIERAPTANT